MKILQFGADVEVIAPEDLAKGDTGGEREDEEGVWRRIIKKDGRQDAARPCPAKRGTVSRANKINSMAIGTSL
ncbi:MAG: hypothetical protein CVU64_21395 [Deltaproteobacteria bacterium HGW-Deltaproteobacteria-21]|nr:MAG: hypothetical protein CVU64_21395 [Deltaproteobacteria bacterium HGW-Deltaproteobacteria-21]